MDQFAEIIERVIRYTDSQPIYSHSLCGAMDAAGERALRTGVRQRVQVGMRRPSLTFVVRPVDRPRRRR